MNKPIISIRGVHKRFPGVHALDNVSLDFYPGEVHALVGENGAGKSTLIKIIAGIYPLEEGEYLIGGENANIVSAADAIRKGISVVYQELSLVEDISVAENLLYGRLPHTKAGIIRWKDAYREAQEILSELGLNISPQIPLRFLSTAQKQLVEIGKAISRNAKVIILDEPTSSLPKKEIDTLFKIIHILKSKGIAVVYVSHKMEELFAITDRITILRDGKWVETRKTSEMTEKAIIASMVGRDLINMYNRSDTKKGDLVLEVEHVSNHLVNDVSFHIRAGEIVGFSGLLGAGRSEIARAVFGLDSRTGSVKICGHKLSNRNPRLAKQLGAGFMSEDRKNEGIFSELNVSDNITIAGLTKYANRIGHINFRTETKAADQAINMLRIKTPSGKQCIAKLSGGNQQKALLARWLINEDLKLLIIDEPTRGIDVGAKAEIYSIMDKLTQQGIAICMISSEMPELLGMCDRIYIVNNGRIVGECDRQNATQEYLMQCAVAQGG